MNWRSLPFTLVLASVALIGLISVGVAWVMHSSRPALGASAATTTTQRSKPSGRAASPPQQLVALHHAQQAHSQPVATSRTVRSVSPLTAITHARARFPVLGRSGRWLKIRLPGRPNGHTGWIQARRTTLSVTAWHLEVDLSQRRVSVYRGGRSVRVFKTVVGKPSAPTPQGEFFVEDSLKLGRTAVGAPFALALSARSDVFQEFAGGPGQIALHGLKNIGGVPGTAVSHGCLRLPNEAMRWLVFHVGIGSPVTITG